MRQDTERAESAFLRGVVADSYDGEALGKYAMFLWLERNEWKAAECLFKAAVEVDPDNPWRAGSYARFLWHAEVCGSWKCVELQVEMNQTFCVYCRHCSRRTAYSQISVSA